ncbi:unnamed protein product [Rotaria sordida]|uniref:MULE transposase domain-containing protein n=1 Tax=Rotaria sordida TaxID=392033 RepID=A0A819T241_9BILA|nr:unnamed protein product [Rotaria sordida]
MALTTFWEITFTLDGDYKSYEFYRVYNHEQEVKTLIQFGLNQLKNNGQLPIVADYTTFDLNKKLLKANAVATRNCTKVDYDVTTLRARQQTQKPTLATVVATTITSTASSLSSNRHSTGSEDSVNTGSQQSSLTAATTRLTPMPDRLRVRTNGNAATASSSSSLSQLAVASRLIKSKTRVSVAKKRGRISENEENDENNDDTSVLHYAAASRNGKSMKAVSLIILTTDNYYFNRIWQDIFVCEDENELLAITKENNTCKKRTEQFNYGLCHTYICAEYRKYPLCKFQLKAKHSSDGTYQLYLSGSHDHQQRNTTARLPSPIREVIIRLSDNGIVTSKINKVMKALHPDLSIVTKVMNVARVQRQKDRSSVKFIQDLQQWCLLRQNVPPPNKQHDIFIPYYVANDVDDLFICLTTRQLLYVCKYSSVLAIDCTYKITTNELSLLVFGTSDYNRRFYPMGICLISTDESADTFRTLFRGIQQWASVVNNQAYTISHVLADEAPGLTTAMSESSLGRRLMYWFHMIKNCRQHAKLIKD